MPCLNILTNLQRNKIPKDFVPRILPVLSKCVNKPVENFVVSVSTECIQSINGDASSPAIVASLESIGNLGPAENKVIARDITEFIEKELGVPKDQVFLTFYDLKASNVAKGGNTVASFMD